METKQENVIRTDYSEIMQKSYIDYAMSVIIDVYKRQVSERPGYQKCDPDG